MLNKVSFFKEFPDEESLVKRFNSQSKKVVPLVNGHIHTPYSFSSFSGVDLIFQMARHEGISVLGINDFFTTDGYDEFAQLSSEYKIFPLFNIEFIALQLELQKEGIRVNDPNNPGRTYLSGKGLSWPVNMSPESEKRIRELQVESNKQSYRMVDKLNDFLQKNDINLQFDADELKQELTRGLFRERHIAQAIRMAIFKKEATPDGRKMLFDKLFSGKSLKSPLSRVAAVENEIRGNLLKAGGAAFVQEEVNAFLPLDEVKQIIIDSGGFPCYPVLLDDEKGNITQYEADPERLMKTLLQNNIYAIELIPGRNEFNTLKDFSLYFKKSGFVVTFGTEHNTPFPEPLRVVAGNRHPLDSELDTINYEGAAVIAAHQYLTGRGEEGYLDGDKAKLDQQDRFINLGKAVIDYFIKR